MNRKAPGPDCIGIEGVAERIWQTFGRVRLRRSYRSSPVGLVRSNVRPFGGLQSAQARQMARAVKSSALVVDEPKGRTKAVDHSVRPEHSLRIKSADDA